MADPLAPAEKVRPIKAVQRCPNCEARTDVSFYVAGAFVRCSRCGVRFEVQRQTAHRAPQVEVHRRPAPPAPRKPEPPQPGSSLDVALDAALRDAWPEAELQAMP